MATIREINLTLVDWETRYVLESLFKEMQRLKKVNAESLNEDESADAGNDYLEISGLYERIASSAENIFGNQILNFNRQ
jgi:hypothetical protein